MQKRDAGSFSRPQKAHAVSVFTTLERRPSSYEARIYGTRKRAVNKNGLRFTPSQVPRGCLAPRMASGLASPRSSLPTSLVAPTANDALASASTAEDAEERKGVQMFVAARPSRH